MADEERPRAELLAEIEELRAEVESLRAHEAQLRQELRLVSDNARATGNILKSTVELTNQATGELRQAKRKAEAAALAKMRFLANMSHELRTPMTAILGYTETLLEEGDLSRAPASRIEHLHTLKRNGQHLMCILNDILDLSKIEANAVDAELVWVSPFEIVADVEGLMRHVSESKKIGLDVSYEPPIPSLVHTDPTRLRQILMNLVGNAIKFTERGGVRIVASFLPASAEAGAMLRFAVSDTGCGLAPEAKDRIFGAFTQADASTTRQYGGTGLGLTISKQLAEILQGDIVAESIEGQGSTFTLTIATGPVDGVPMIADPDSYHSLPMPGQEEEEENTLSFMARVSETRPGVRMLLVEDGEDNRRLISYTLAKAGFEATHAENGRVGVELAMQAREAGESYDLILMDMQMPVMDGYEATKRLRVEGFQTPIIALTAHAMSGDRERCIEAGCDAFHTKPIQRRALIELILEQLGKEVPAA